MSDIKKVYEWYQNKFLHTNHIRPMLKYLIKQNNEDSFHHNNLIGCEVGVDDGKHAFNMLYWLPTNKLYLIDSYEEYENYPYLKKGKPINPDIVYSIARKKLSRFGDKPVFIRKYSDKITNDDIKEGELDFCYIDANHTYRFVKNDIELFYTKVKNGGVLGGHDFGAGTEHGDVARAVLEFCDKHDLKLFGGVCDWWIKK